MLLSFSDEVRRVLQRRRVYLRLLQAPVFVGGLEKNLMELHMMAEAGGCYALMSCFAVRNCSAARGRPAKTMD